MALWWPGGAIAESPQDAMALWHCDKPFMVTFEANWEGRELGSSEPLGQVETHRGMR